MKNNRIVVKDLGVLSYEDSWEHQKTIFDNIISQKIKNRTLKKKNKTDNYLLIVEHNQYLQLVKVEILQTFYWTQNNSNQKIFNLKK